MTDTYKILGQALTGELALDDSTVKETIVYEVPAETKASVSAIEITNSDTSNQTYKVAFVPSSDVQNSTSISYDVSLAEGRFVSVGYQLSSYSTDGITWIDGNLSVPEGWSEPAYGNGKFVTLAIYSSSLAYSTDGANWTVGTLPYGGWRHIIYANEKFVAVSYTPTHAGYSIDGITWTLTTLPSFGPNTLYDSVAYGNGVFVSPAGYSSNFAYSQDGITWAQGDMPSFAEWGEIVYGNGKFICIVPFSQGKTAYSEDGITWEQVNIPNIINWGSPKLVYGNNKFIIVTSSEAFYSTDGVSWSTSSIPTTAFIASLTYGNGKFMYTTYAGSAVHSTDGVTWTLSVGTVVSSNSVSYAEPTVQKTLQQAIPQSLNKHIAIYNKTIASGETHEIKGGVTLSAGDQIRVYSDSSGIITNVYGVEIQ
jgi:hypothetical protein